MKKFLSLFLVIFICFVCVASCGNTDDPGSFTTPTGSSSVSTSSATSSSSTSSSSSSSSSSSQSLQSTSTMETEEQKNVVYVTDSNSEFTVKLLPNDNGEYYGVAITSWKLNGETLDIPLTYTYDKVQTPIVYDVVQIGTPSCGAIADINLKKLTVPSSVKIICANAFMMSKGLEQVTLSEGLQEIDEFAFWSSGVKTINLPSTLKSIGECAFSGCSNLTSIVIPSSVEEIGDDAFCGCRSLVSVTIPRRFETEISRIFTACPNISVTYID